MNHIVDVKDGDEISVIVELPPNPYDPAGESPAIAQTFRVVAHFSGPTLVLVPMAHDPVRITERAMMGYRANQTQKV